MFTFGWGEIFLIGIIVVVVIGPKDLPKFIKRIGFLLKNIRKISSDFKSSINEIAEETEIKDLAKNNDNIDQFDNSDTEDDTNMDDFIQSN